MIEKILQQLGFSEKEADVYLALLQLGKANVSELAQKTKLPRSTIYGILEEFRQRGVVFEVEHKKIKEFSPQNPKKLLADLQNRTQAFKHALPELQELFRSASVQPHIRYFVGKEELREMYDGILEKRGLHKYDIIAAEEQWIEMSPHFFQEFKKRRAGAGIFTRLILEYSAAAEKRKAEERATHSQVKILPPALSAPFHGGCYIFSDSVIFVAYRKEHVAVEISSPEITSVLQMMFNFMWKFLSNE